MNDKYGYPNQENRLIFLLPMPHGEEPGRAPGRAPVLLNLSNRSFDSNWSHAVTCSQTLQAEIFNYVDRKRQCQLQFAKNTWTHEFYPYRDANS